ncbi:MAG: hypothetical protein NZ928_00075 [Endomicrobia bacterium]|nr:hypothetical protein [Endomicrobiia bacterium]MDW8055935.1 hypothetical protein [Elusimicrobiota bacterium]
MKVKLIILTLFSCLSFVLAHPPSNIDLILNLDEKEVEVVVFHKVKDTQDHYIDKILLFLNGKKIIEQISSKQLNNENQIYLFKIPELKENDKINVSVKCNKFGELKKEIIVKIKKE